MNHQEAFNEPESIAVIGMDGRFPGAKNLNSFWQNLRDGVESISSFTDAELLASGVDAQLLQDPNYVKAKGVLTDIELFDAAFFGFNPKEAAITDPQHRLFLECAWTALENAGYNSEIYPGRIGVYAGVSLGGYLFYNLANNENLLESIGTYQTLLSNDRDFLTTQVSYKLNLNGPSVVIQTACSTSLVAIHFACQSLIAGESDMALAGGVSISVPHRVGYSYQKGGIFAPDGHCRAFDAKAEGTVAGSGVGIVVLKRLEDALADRDCIHAVIKGSAINNDGAVKVGYTAPSLEGQKNAIAQAQAVAGIAAQTITYIETHGTGTVLGDPIEIAALQAAFRESTAKNGFCAIGSVKTNIGHLDAAAGVAGLIKTVLALKHKLIPPSLNFQQPNPQIDFCNSPFYVNTTLSPWETNNIPRRAGVSSFGIGGTNAHVIVEEAPSIAASSPPRPWELLLLSAKTASALDIATVNLVEHLRLNPEINLGDVAYTLQVGRRGFNHRRFLVCQDINDAVTTLEIKDSPRVLTFHTEQRHPPVVFMFPGQGTQYVNMAWELYQVEPTFQEALDLCCELFQRHQGLDLRKVLYPQEQVETATQQLNQTAVTQSALFAIAYSLAKLWMSWGIHPQAMIGHSIGEYVAAHLAGVFSLEEAVALVAARGQIMQQLPRGSMLAVPLSAQQVQPFLNEQLCLAAINAPSLCVVSGSTDAIAQLENHLVTQGLKVRRLLTSHAFHSQMTDPILESFRQQVNQVHLHPPQIPYVSNVTGNWITDIEATDPNYWVKHLRQTVRFADGLKLLLQASNRLFLEVGPGKTLSTFVRQSLQKADHHFILSTLKHPQNQQSDREFLLTTLGQIWLAGVEINWSKFYQYEKHVTEAFPRSRLPLPTYPFERQRYWIEPQKQTDTLNKYAPSSKKNPDINSWFYMPVWKQSMPPQPVYNTEMIKQKSCWLVFVDECGLGTQLVQRLQQENQDVISVEVGEEFVKVNQHRYILNPQQRDDYDTLINNLGVINKIPQTIVHLWSVTPNQHTDSDIDFWQKTQNLGFYSLLYLTQALAEQNFTDSLQIALVSNNIQQITGLETLCPEKATILGACKVIPQEYPNITLKSIDIDIDINKSKTPDPLCDSAPLREKNSPANSKHHQTVTTHKEKLVDQILSELIAKLPNSIIAYRSNHRWVQTFESVQLDISPTPRLRHQGVYLITGGLGGMGLILAEYLAQTVQARLILIGRSAFPSREEWQQWQQTHDPQDKITSKILKIQALEELGAKVLVKNADVANLEQMQLIIQEAYQTFGAIHGVIHAAGIAGGGVIQLKTPEVAESVFYPKVIGAKVLDTILKNQQLDFFILCSSLNSVLGGFGQIDYCAANNFLDAFADFKTAKDGIFTISINWDTWQEVGMAVNTAVPIELKQLQQENLNKGILSSEGQEVFSRILRQHIPQLIVSTQDLKLVIEQNHSLKVSSTLEKFQQLRESKSTHSRPKLPNAYVAPRNETEQIISQVWQELLGIEQVGIHDNFFELGGHSLLATQLMSKINEVLRVDLPVRRLLEASTIAQLAVMIEAVLIAEIAELTEEQVEYFLKVES
ncbi:acyltransferase domain-containing protein [Calothrix sp. FACHB-1219]|uniref:type I polyketide synthase n=1 Tax=unclassified Calothrix TaxID=2619626 RepID=UPI0016867BFB|nr:MULTISPECIES: type I polyketide synthase [unclassified Calothrix]MBD2207318.1 acyltransferase domain-containing protein [Calothrix sp. FACHB-168]MBD2221939.1 acyltransferase domain-containing protein [Calothrix sp. FACHB-1219]